MVVDMLHSVIFHIKFLEHIFVILEDGGEMFVMSVITWYVYTLHDDPNIENKK